jgi:ABC transport system ATP-binding/permease protein
VSFTAKPGTLTAVIGPSGAGKSTLVKLVGGAMPRSAGLVAFDGHDVHAEYASMRSRIGMVPQDDVVHRQLTVEQALNFAAELRLPPDTTADDRRQVVQRVLDELELAPHKDTRVDKLSGGQRKRASVAMELLTGPSLLILDEPTSGLDPALDRQVMTMLRRLADAGRVVIVVTHSLTYVGMCDQILLLAPGGKTAYADPPAQIGSAMGSTDWADIFARVSTDPDGAHRAYLSRHPPSPRRLSPTAGAAPLGTPPRTSPWRQVMTLVRRQTRLITSDRGYFAFLAVLPFVLGVLSLVVSGTTGLGAAGATEEPIDILILLDIGAVFLGTALTVRDLVGERMIFHRERAVGLSASAYLIAKVIVYSIAALIGTAVMVAIMTIGKGTPSHGGALLGHGVVHGVLELYLGLALTAITSAMVGLALSSLARSGEQVLPMLVVTIMVSMVLAGGLIPVTGRLVLDQLAWFVPARWGFAASASTVDLNSVEAGLPIDRLWRHEAGAWLQDVGMLAALAAALAGLVRYRLRLGNRAR